jgi:hypothetical protein
MKKIILVAAAIMLLFASYIVVTKSRQGDFSKIVTFEDCSHAGFPVMTTYPAQCQTPDGRRFVDKAENVAPPVACTMDAKLCPDGSSVGRVSPSCEFALCPEEATPSATP